MLVPLDYPFCSELYIVEKTIHVVARIAGDDRQIRIEALHNPTSPTAYSTRSYINERVTNDNGEQRGTWVDYDLPWASGGTADEVLTKALWLLGKRCPKK
jgi:hypothetical protein